jgi:hypothetical protein
MGAPFGHKLLYAGTWLWVPWLSSGPSQRLTASLIKRNCKQILAVRERDGGFAEESNEKRKVVQTPDFGN